MAFHSAELRAAAAGEARVVSPTLRAFALLECIATADESPTLEELTRASGLPKPTVHRILRLLMRGDLVEREVNDKRYAIGPRACALSLAVQIRSPRRRERHAILARLSRTRRNLRECALAHEDGLARAVALHSKRQVAAFEYAGRSGATPARLRAP